MRLALRSLLLLSALLLVPPPGWCCFVLDFTEPCESAAPKQQLPAKSPKSCCNHESQPQPQQQPAHKPIQSLQCCCPAMDTVQPEKTAKATADATVLFSPIVAVPNVIGLPSLVLPGCDSVTAATSLHILHCVWLC
jgi:hypothetical protein